MRDFTAGQSFCKLLYRETHLACPYYDLNMIPLVELIDLNANQSVAKNIDDTFIYYVSKGTLQLSCKGEESRTIAAGHMILLPIGVEMTATAKEDCSFVACRLRNAIHLCLSLDIEGLYHEVAFRESNASEHTSPVLEANIYIRTMFESFVTLIGMGLRCSEYIEGKFDELLILLRIFYPKETLAVFFSPLLSGDALFKRKVLENYQKARSVEELASLTNNSVNGFLKKFKKNIGETPSRWINREKARKIHTELVCGEKPLKLLAEEYGFSSISYFNQFCKKNLGETPGRIRLTKENNKGCPIPEQP